jgi:hypothetical protein
MKASDMTPEEQAAHYARVRQALESADETLAETDAWLERRRVDGTDFEERAEARQREERDRASRQPQPLPPATPPPPRQETKMDPENSRRWNDWCDKRIVDLLKIQDECLVEDLKKAFLEAREISRREQRAAIDELRADVTRSEAAVTELLMEMEREIKELRERAITRPARPKLIGWNGGGDGA